MDGSPVTDEDAVVAEAAVAGADEVELEAPPQPASAVVTVASAKSVVWGLFIGRSFVRALCRGEPSGRRSATLRDGMLGAGSKSFV